MLPHYESTFALVRNTRGIQMIDMTLHKSHQLCLSDLPGLEYEDHEMMRNMLYVFLDLETWKYTFATICQEDADKEIGLCGYTAPTEFIHGLKLFEVNKDKLNN